MKTPKLVTVTLLSLAFAFLPGCKSVSPMDKLAKQNLALQAQLKNGEITQTQYNEKNQALIEKAKTAQEALDKAAAEKAAADKAAADKAAADKAAAQATK